MTTETAIHSALQTAVQGMTEFANVDVLINDFTIFDKAISGAPFFIISTADDFEARQDTMTPNGSWRVRGTLLEEFTGWKATMDNLRDDRQAIIDMMNTGANRTLSIEGLDCPSIINDSPITAWFDPMVRAEEIAEATPIYLFQDMLFEFREF